MPRQEEEEQKDISTFEDEEDDEDLFKLSQFLTKRNQLSVESGNKVLVAQG